MTSSALVYLLLVKRSDRINTTQTYSTVRASLCLVESAQSQGADMTSAVVAWRDTLVDNRRSANEADLGLDILVAALWY